MNNDIRNLSKWLNEEQEEPIDRQALARVLAMAEQQEPVAAECKFDSDSKWRRCSIEHHNLVQSEPHRWPGYQARLLYTSPPAQRKPLTDEEILVANYPDGEENGPTIAAPNFELICFARQIESKLKEKNK